MFGLAGELKIDATRLGTDALRAGAVVHGRCPDGSERNLVVRTMRMHKGRPLIAFDGFGDAGMAQALVGATLMLDRADVRLAPGEYLDDDLVGCRVVDGGGVDVGAVIAVEHFPAADMLVVGSGRTLIPMVAAIIVSIDVGTKRIVVDAPAGLLDEREADLG